MTTEPLVTYTFDVEAGQVRRFAEAAWDPRSTAPGPLGLPLTYLGAAPSLAGRPHSLRAMGFDVARAFHGTEEVEVLAPVGAGDSLTVQEGVHALPSVAGRRGGTMRRAERRCTFLTHTGETVARTHRVILETAAPLTASTSGGGSRPFDDGLDAHPVPRGLDAVRTGHEWGPASFGPLTLTDFVRYAAASADLTAIHFDELAAASRGYPGPFAMGMLSAAFLGTCLDTWLTPEPPWRVSVRFQDLVWPGETLTISARAVGQSYRAECRAGARVVTTADLTLGLPQPAEADPR